MSPPQDQRQNVIKSNTQSRRHSINVFSQKAYPSKQEFYVIAPKFMVLKVHKFKINLSSSGKTETIAASTAVNSSHSCIGFLVWTYLALVLLLPLSHFLQGLVQPIIYLTSKLCHLQLLHLHQLTSCWSACRVQPATN